MKKELRTSLGVLVLSLFTTFGMAQDLQKPTLEDLIPGGETYRSAQNLQGLHWWGNKCIEGTIDSLFAVDPRTGAKTLLTTREKVIKRMREQKLGTIPYMYSFPTIKAGVPQLLIPGAAGYIVYDWEADSILSVRRFLKARPTTRDYNLESGNFAYTIKDNLYVNDKQVTNDYPGYVNGQSVSRNEFGINKGTFWSPKGDRLAFYHMDERDVTKYPLVDITKRVAKVDNVRYPMAGMTSQKVSIGIYNPSINQTIYLSDPIPDYYLTNIAWAPDGKSIYVIELNRDQNHAKLCRYNATTGEPMGVLLEETHPKYVEPQHPIVFLPWDSSRFIYQSERDGFNHLYLYDTDGRLIRQLTAGDWLVQDLIGFNADKKEVIVTTTERSPLQSNTYKVNIANGRRTLLDNGEGVHRAVPTPSGRYFIDTYSTPTVPRSINLSETARPRSINLLTAADPYKDFTLPSVEVGTLKAADGTTDLYYRITRPADFDPTKKYPVMIYVYGGPHAQMINATYRYGVGGYHLYMASRGYIVFTLDNRGSSNRGREFEQCTFRRLGIEECKDQVCGVDFLKSLPYVDASRIGVHGWSYGGHMTTALMLRYPDLFKVGVSGGPVIDWAYYEVMYGERYMDTPQTNPEGYAGSNLKNLAGRLKGHLLLIHDDHDDTCVPQHTLSFLKACVDARTYPDLFIYPGHKHNVSGRDRVHLHEKITRYFDDYLK
ncbi:MAG: DPP IV N-terminal domain-containing protein [Prevotellaceae bacterium]|jgi:dipeptidyl-peptidase-4|nr:DPP IV N-terminal domain-containing protein [Prevotellaceae bacterium]